MRSDRRLSTAAILCIDCGPHLVDLAADRAPARPHFRDRCQPFGGAGAVPGVLIDLGHRGLEQVSCRLRVGSVVPQYAVEFDDAPR